jgi:site-specific recombinase XerD
MNKSVLQRASKKAARKLGLAKPASCYTLRRSFATHLVGDGYDIWANQELLRHHDVSTTMMYLPVLNRGGKGVYRLIDRLP